ncbi:hypothetical protein HDF11_004059 [Tunturiibacter psychrotolerans]
MQEVLISYRKRLVYPDIHEMTHLLCFTSHAHQFRSHFFDPLGDNPETDHTKVVLDFKLNSFFCDNSSLH